MCIILACGVVWLALSILSLVNVPLAKVVMQHFDFWFLLWTLSQVCVLLTIVCPGNMRFLIWWFGVFAGYLTLLFIDAVPIQFYPKVRLGAVFAQPMAFVFMVVVYISVALRLQPVADTKITFRVLSPQFNQTHRSMKWEQQEFHLSDQLLSLLSTMILYTLRNMYSIVLHPHRTLVLTAEPELIVGEENIAKQLAHERRLVQAALKIRNFMQGSVDAIRDGRIWSRGGESRTKTKKNANSNALVRKVRMQQAIRVVV